MGSPRSRPKPPPVGYAARGGRAPTQIWAQWLTNQCDAMSRKDTCEGKRQSQGRVHVWRVANARTFSRSTRGLVRYSQRAATLPARHTTFAGAACRHAQMRIRPGHQKSQEDGRGHKLSLPVSTLIKAQSRGRLRASPLLLDWAWLVAEYPRWRGCPNSKGLLNSIW